MRPVPLFPSLRVVGDTNGRPFNSNLSPKGPFNDPSPNCLLHPFGTATDRNPAHWYRSCMTCYGRFRSQIVNSLTKRPFVATDLCISNPMFYCTNDLFSE
ncbi:hypothetical protein AVEN_139169-1 [Araneus ventricosus]|uniref:Uncharacterized protein n=1 Tax=Araneus ventricosus TaxID=182803 RepID=A0A4Y2K4Y6_ARAVE|nr:hypothetical protein AVEN_139169-1 [Araneus ventricosus]